MGDDKEAPGTSEKQNLFLEQIHRSFSEVYTETELVDFYPRAKRKHETPTMSALLFL